MSEAKQSDAINKTRSKEVVMKKLVYLIDEKVNLVVILFLFWALFWGLNGGDKFFNGEWVRYMGRETHKAELVDLRGVFPTGSTPCTLLAGTESIATSK